MADQPNCEYCLRPLYGQEAQPTADGKLLHWACRSEQQPAPKCGTREYQRSLGLPPSTEAHS